MREQDVAVYALVEEIPGQQWNTLAQGADFPLTTPMLALTQRARPKTARFFLCRDSLVALGALPLYLIEESTTVSSYLRPDLMLRRLAGEHRDLPWPGADELLPAAFLGAHQPAAARLLVNRLLSGPEQQACIAGLLERVEEQACDWGVRSLCCPYVAPAQQNLREAFIARGYLCLPGSWLARLDIRWPDFAGYLDSLPGHQRRIVRWERRKVAAAGFSVETVPLREDLVPRLEALKANVERKYHGEAASPLPADSVLAIAARTRPGEPLVTLARKGAEIVGFGLSYRYLDELYCEQVGFDYEQVAGTHLYFEIAFYQLLDYALACGIRCLHYGPQAYRAKRLRGCLIEPHATFLKCVDPRLQRRLAQIARTLDEQELYQESVLL